jgi:hypothetical protein
MMGFHDEPSGSITGNTLISQITAHENNVSCRWLVSQRLLDTQRISN